MLLSTIGGSSLAASIAPCFVSVLQLYRQHLSPLIPVRSYHVQPLVAEQSPINLLLNPLEGQALNSAASPDPVQQQQTTDISRELILRYSTHFPDALYSHLAGLVQGRPFPTAVDMSCTAVGVAGAELGRRGFCVAEAAPPCPTCHPGTSSSASAAIAGGLSGGHQHPHQHRLPCGCSDVVALLPGPSDLSLLGSSSSSSLGGPHQGGGLLLAEARRLMAPGGRGYLAVAWNDRDLSSPFVADLEALLESINPAYCRTSRQHNPPAVLSALMSGDGGYGGSSSSLSSPARPPSPPPPPLALESFMSLPHSLPLACGRVLQDLLGGFAVVRSHTAASSTHRKAFHQALRALIRHHFGDEEAPLDLPLVTRLYILRQQQQQATATTTATTQPQSTLADSSNSSAASAPDAPAMQLHNDESSSSSSCGCGFQRVPAAAAAAGEGEGYGCMTHHVRTRRTGLSSRDSCTLRHLYA